MQVLLQGSTLQHILALAKESENPISAMQVCIAWLALLLLSFRRLMECYSMPSSASRMFAGHWVMGLLFYAVTSIAVWIEGDRDLLAHQVNPETLDSDWVLLLVNPNISAWKQVLILLGIGFFFIGSVVQGNVHGYFCELKELTKGKYTLPTHPFFNYTMTPHYAAECLQYLGLALILAPHGQIFSSTMLCCFVFVLVNLGVTADETRNWYKLHFGADKVDGKSRMIPFIW